MAQQATLRIDSENSTIPLNGDRYVIGRSDECEIVLPEAEGTVSRRHAILERGDDGSWSLIDLASRNGTFVNGEKVRDRYVLSEGAALRLGHVSLTLVLPQVAPAASFVPARQVPAPTVVIPPPQPSTVAISAPIASPALPPNSTSFEEQTVRSPSIAEPSVSSDPSFPAPVQVQAPRIPRPAASPSESPAIAAPSPFFGLASVALAAFTAVSGFLPWAQVNFWLLQGSATYFDLCKVGLQESGRDSRAYLVLVPALSALLLIFSCMTKGRSRGSLLLAAGIVGLVASGSIYNFLSSGIGGDIGPARVQINATSILGAGYNLFTCLAIVSLVLGIAAISSEGRKTA